MRLSPAEHRRPLREQAVAKAHHQQLRRQILAGRPGGADVLAAATLGAGHRVEHLLPRHVDERPRAEPQSALVLDLEIERLEPPPRARPAEPDVDPGGRDVEVLRVREVHEEPEDREHVEPDEGALERLRRRPVAEEAGERVRHRRPAGRPFVQAERDLRRVPSEQRRHDQRNQPENHVGLAEVAPLEPRRPLHLADSERRDDSDEHEHAEQVDEEEVPALLPEPGERPVRVDGPEERHDDRRGEDDEPPEDERVDEAGNDALEELSLAEDDGRLGLRAPPEIARAVGRLPETDDPVEEVRPPREERRRDRERGEERDRRERRAHPDRAARIAALIAGTTSCRSPITA